MRVNACLFTSLSLPTFAPEVSPIYIARADSTCDVVDVYIYNYNYGCFLNA